MTSKRYPYWMIFVLIIYLLFSVVLVWIGVNQIETRAPELSFMFEGTIRYAVMFGVPMSVFAGLTSYFSKGDLQRLVFGLMTSALLVLYLYFVMNSLNLGWQGDELVYTITPSGILILFIIAAALKGIYHVLEFFVHKGKGEEEVVVEHREEFPQEAAPEETAVYY